MANYLLSIPKIILDNEGFFSNDKADKGGVTVFGLIKGSDKDWIGWKIINDYLKEKNLTEITEKNIYPLKQRLYENAIPFYKVKYWDKVCGDKINNQQIAHSLCDAAVNVGIKQSIIQAQRAAKFKETGVMSNEFLNTLNS